MFNPDWGADVRFFCYGAWFVSLIIVLSLGDQHHWAYWVQVLTFIAISLVIATVGRQVHRRQSGK